MLKMCFFFKLVQTYSMLNEYKWLMAGQWTLKRFSNSMEIPYWLIQHNSCLEFPIHFNSLAIFFSIKTCYGNETHIGI